MPHFDPLSRRTFLGGLAATPSLLTAQPRKRPNVIVLLTDDQRWDALGCMGNKIIQTPNVDRLSREGVTFLNNFVTTSICMVSRTSIFTGQYLSTHGINEFAAQLSPDSMTRTYPGVLRAAGYRTGFIGKWGLDKKPLPEANFEYWKGFPGQGNYFPEGPNGPHLNTVMQRQALEFLGGCTKDRPFFLQISFKAPHVQDEAPKQFLEDPADLPLYRDINIPMVQTGDTRYISQLPIDVHRSENRRRWGVRFSTPELYQASVKSYFRLITGVDRVVGAIRKELAARGMDQDTVIIYTSDNGFYLAEHGLAGKWLMHEESIRTPLVIYDPRLPSNTAGTRREEMTLNIDVGPTVLALAGLETPRSMQGRSIQPLLGRGAAANWRRDFFYEHTFTARGWIPRVEGVRSGRWKYTKYLDADPLFEELFDLAADPHEEHNLARSAAHKARLEQMRARYAVWKKTMSASTHRNGWAAGEPEPPPVGF